MCPAQRWILIQDNLSVHHSRMTQLALLAWPEIEIRWLPQYACWLNLIEPWWKQLRGLALQGRRLTSVQELCTSLIAATAYWNQHRHPYQWRKAA